MTPRKAADCGRQTSSDSPPKPIPELPAWKAFVVQFSREAGAQVGVFNGRVEHLSSGRRARFGSSEELISILSKLLGEIGADSIVDESED